MNKKTEDAVEFGEGAWIYCKSHMRPHSTGWCTVDVRNKIRLDAKTWEDALAECKANGFKIFGENQ